MTSDFYVLGVLDEGGHEYKTVCEDMADVIFLPEIGFESEAYHLKEWASNGPYRYFKYGYTWSDLGDPNYVYAEPQHPTKTFTNRNLRVVLDRREVFPDDPGNGTPAMVYWDGARGSFSATYWCAIGEAELLNGRGGIKELTDSQLEWLDSLEHEINRFLDV